MCVVGVKMLCVVVLLQLGSVHRFGLELLEGSVAAKRQCHGQLAEWIGSVLVGWC